MHIHDISHVQQCPVVGKGWWAGDWGGGVVQGSAVMVGRVAGWGEQG